LRGVPPYSLFSFTLPFVLLLFEGAATRQVFLFFSSHFFFGFFIPFLEEFLNVLKITLDAFSMGFFLLLGLLALLIDIPLFSVLCGVTFTGFCHHAVRGSVCLIFLCLPWLRPDSPLFSKCPFGLGSFPDFSTTSLTHFLSGFDRVEFSLVLRFSLSFFLSPVPWPLCETPPHFGVHWGIFQFFPTPAFFSVRSSTQFGPPSTCPRNRFTAA